MACDSPRTGIKMANGNPFGGPARKASLLGRKNAAQVSAHQHRLPCGSHQAIMWSQQAIRNSSAASQVLRIKVAEACASCGTSRLICVHLWAAKRTLISASAAMGPVKIDLNCVRHPSQTPIIGGTRLRTRSLFLGIAWTPPRSGQRYTRSGSTSMLPAKHAFTTLDRAPAGEGRRLKAELPPTWRLEMTSRESGLLSNSQTG